MVKDFFVRNKKVILYILAILTFVIVPVLMYLPYLINQQIPVAGDGYGSSLLNRLSANKILFEDGISFWNANIECGMPYGGYIKGILNPLYLIASLFPAELNFYAYYFIHLILGASFMFLFLKEIKIHPVAAYVVSLIYETSIHLNGYRKEHTEIIIATAFVPVILFFVQKYLNNKKLHWLVLSAFMMGLQFMGGQTQNVLYWDIAVFVYLVIYLIKNKQSIKLSIIHILAWLATYFGVIAFDLLAIARQLTKYGSIADGSIEFMQAWSIHFIKLVMGLFPNFFDDQYWEFTYLYSSGFDIELFLGIFIAFCALFAIIKLRNNFNVKLCGALWCVAFGFSAMAHIPYLANIMINIPIINSFRVPSRALFIAIFFAFVLAAHTLSAIFEKDTLSLFLDFIRKISIGVVCAVSAVYVIAAAVTELGFTPFVSQVEKSEFIEKCNTMFSPTLWICVAAIPITLLIQKLELKQIAARISGYKSIIVCACVLLSTVLETYPLSFQADTTSFGKLDYKSDEIIDAIAKDNYYKLIDTSSSLISTSYNLSDCGNAYRGIYGVNAYLNYNNPVLYKALSGTELHANASGSFLSISGIKEALFSNNDLLSVLGIKYINDTDGMLEYPGFIDDNKQYKSFLCEFDDFAFEPGPSNVYNMPVRLKPYTIYQIEFDMEYDAAPAVVYIDTLSESGQYKNAKYISEKGHISTTITTDNEYYTLARIVASNEEAPVKVSGIKLHEVNTSLETVEPDDIAFEQKNIILKQTSDDSDYSFYAQDDVKLERNTNYCVEIEARSETVPAFFYADLFTPDYDNAEQQISISLENGIAHIKEIINTGDVPDSVSFRMVYSADSDISVEEVRIYKASAAENQSNRYQLFAERSDVPDTCNKIYINPNAKDILFTTDYVKSLTEDLDYFYTNPLNYNLLESTYISGEIDEMNLTGAETSIENIEFSSDCITAQVVSSSETFVNFSQTFDSGWKAYVDGVQTEVFMTDGVIMGIKVPSGSHTIRFEYRPEILVIGLIITFATAIFWLAFFVIKKIRSSKANSDLHTKS